MCSVWSVTCSTSDSEQQAHVFMHSVDARRPSDLRKYDDLQRGLLVPRSLRNIFEFNLLVSSGNGVLFIKEQIGIYTKVLRIRFVSPELFRLLAVWLASAVTACIDKS